jgi:hypothetical protein
VVPCAGDEAKGEPPISTSIVGVVPGSSKGVKPKSSTVPIFAMIEGERGAGEEAGGRARGGG